MTGTEFTKLYNEYERKYNPYPCQMSRAEVFTKLLQDEIITKEDYDQAREYYGRLWFYVGD